MDMIKTALTYALLGLSLAVASLPVRADDEHRRDRNVSLSSEDGSGGNADNAGQGAITGLNAGSEGVLNSGPFAPDNTSPAGFGQATGSVARDVGGLGNIPEGCGESLC